MTRSTWSLGLSATLITLAACDSQVAPDYEGEPLVTLTGTASSPEPLPPIDIYAELEWVSFLSNGDDAMNGGGSKLASEGEFPARFTLEVFHEPWDAWLNDFSRNGASPRESRIGLALLRADGEMAFHSSGWNAFARHVLVYVDSDIQPGTTSETFAGGLLTAGFHVLEVVDAPCDSYLPADDPSEGGLDCLRPAPQDLDSQLDLRFFREAESQPEHPPEVPHLFD